MRKEPDKVRRCGFVSTYRFKAGGAFIQTLNGPCRASERDAVQWHCSECMERGKERRVLRPCLASDARLAASRCAVNCVARLSDRTWSALRASAGPPDRLMFCSLAGPRPHLECALSYVCERGPRMI